MAASNTAGIDNPLTASSVILPVETTTTTTTNTIATEGRDAVSTSNTSTNFVHRWGLSIPDIPEIPSLLMRPPNGQKSEAQSTGAEATVGSNSTLPFSSSCQGSVARHGLGSQSECNQRSEDFFDADRAHENLDNMIRNQVGRQVDRVFASSLKDLQGHLSAKAHEVDQLRAEFQSMEHKEKDLLSGIPWQNENHTRTAYTSQFVPSTYGAPMRSGSLGTRTAGLLIPGTGTTGMEFAVRESTAQIEDLKKKLRMTTELCAKQDAYYREVVGGLENQLKESIAGRDHVLTLRENEAASQLQLIHQLESGLRKQQQITATKDEALNSVESKLNQQGEDLNAHKSIVDKIRRILLEEEKKRFRAGLVTSALENSSAVGQIGDAMVEILQKCLFDDDNGKKTLRAQLERVEAEFKSSSQLTDNRQEELQKEYKARISKLEEEHSQALDLSASRAAHVRKDLETLQEETGKLKQQHQTEVAAMEDKVKSLDVELNKTRTSSNETTVLLETKGRELECSVRELKAEVQIVREEKEKLLMQFSQEQASVIALNEKYSKAEQLCQEEAKKAENLVKKLNTLQEKYTDEVECLKSDITEKETLLKEIREEAARQRDSDVEKALKEEKEKSNTRLDGILNELTKSNHNVSTLTSNLETKKLELSKLQEENDRMKEDLELRCKEMNLIREEKLKLAVHLEEKEKELSITHGGVTELRSSLEGKANNLLAAETLIEKLQTQLSERERTVASFQEQGTNLAEIIEKNSQTGDSLQREREQLIRTLEERISEVEEMKSHREILAKKLRAKDKRVKELEEEKGAMENSLKIKREELDALMEDRSNIMAELKLRQIEVTKLRDENDSLSSLMEGKDGEREKEITKLLSRLKGSEQDLSLTRKLLKTKGDMSGKAVRVAESMQKEVTAKRGELDTLQNKIHWLKENLDTATKDARYYERKSNEVSATVKELTVQRDQLDYELRKNQKHSDEYRKQLNHMEQALEKAALKHAESQGIIEKMEQEMARLKLKHSLEIKELERNPKAGPLSVRPEAGPLAELLSKLNSGFRWPPLTSQANFSSLLIPQKTPLTQPLQALLPTTQGSQAVLAEQESGMRSGQLSQEANDASSKKNDEVSDDLKTLLHEVRSLISSFQAHASQTMTPTKAPGVALTSEGPPAERGPLDDGPRRREGSDPDTHDHEEVPGSAVHKKERRGDRVLRAGTQKKAPEEGRYRSTEEGPRRSLISSEGFARGSEGSEVSSVTTDLNLRLSSDYGLEEGGEDGDDILPPLHSSSPKKDSVNSSELPTQYSIPRDTPHSALSLSLQGDDSDVTSLLIDDQSTSTGDTVISRDFKHVPLPVKRRSVASSVCSSQRSSSRKSSVVSDVVELPRKQAVLARAETVQRQHKVATSWKPGDKTRGDGASIRKTSSESEPVYRRAEMILQSLAQTGEHLTKKNKEIEHLLKEQHKRIKKCRKNEDNIHALLT